MLFLRTVLKSSHRALFQADRVVGDAVNLLQFFESSGSGVGILRDLLSCVQVMDQMKKEPTDAELMKEAISVVRNGSNSGIQKLQALRALRYLVEPIDNAKGRLRHHKKWS